MFKVYNRITELMDEASDKGYDGRALIVPGITNILTCAYKMARMDQFSFVLHGTRLELTIRTPRPVEGKNP